MKTTNSAYSIIRFNKTSMLLALVTIAFGTIAEAQSPPKSYDELVVEARLFLAQKKPQEAVTQSEAAIRADDKRWEAYVTAATGYSQQKLYDDAVGMLQMALIRAPQDKKQLVRDAIEETRKQIGRGQPGTGSAASGSATPTAASTPTQAEIVLWKTIENSANVSDFRAYLQQYPNGTFAALAAARIEKLEQAESQQHQVESRRLEEQKRQQAEVASRDVFPVALITGFHFRWGHLVITDDGLSYSGSDGGNFSFEKTQIAEWKAGGYGMGGAASPKVGFRTKTGEKYSFHLIDENQQQDVLNGRVYSAYGLGQLVPSITRRWGFRCNANGICTAN